MSESPLTYAQIEAAAQSSLRRLTEVTNNLRRDLIVRANKDAAYRSAFAKARLARKYEDGKKLSIPEAADAATIDTEEEYREFVIAEAEAKASAAERSSISTRIEMLRSLMTSHREVST